MKMYNPVVKYTSDLETVSEPELVHHVNHEAELCMTPGLRIKTVAKCVLKRSKDVRPIMQRVAKSNLDAGENSVTYLLLDMEYCFVRTKMAANSELLNQMVTAHYNKSESDFKASILHMIRNQSNFNVNSVFTTMCNKGTMAAALGICMQPYFPEGPGAVRKVIYTSLVYGLVTALFQMCLESTKMQRFLMLTSVTVRGKI